MSETLGGLPPLGGRENAMGDAADQQLGSTTPTEPKPEPVEENSLDTTGEQSELATNAPSDGLPATNFGGDISPVAGVVVNGPRDEETGFITETLVVTESGETSTLASPLNNRDIINPEADNRHPNPVPREPRHTYTDNSPDKPENDEDFTTMETV